MSALIVSHTHWDRAWYLPFQHFRLRLLDLVDGVLDTLEAHPRFPAFLLDGQSILLEDYLEARPQAGARVRSLVEAGRLVIGPWYVLPDEFLVSGESLIRNLLRGRQVAEGFGACMPAGYVPDSFGHVHTLPQVLNGFGIDSFVFMRGMPASEYQRLGREFVWEGPAGSAVVAVYLRDGYYNAAALGFPAVDPHPVALGDFEGQDPDAELAIQQLRKAAAAAATGSRAPSSLLMNGMDHMPIQPRLPDLLEAQATAEDAVEIRHATLPEYVKLVGEIAHDLPRYRGELRGNAHHPILAGVHSARIYLKQQNQMVQALLASHAEPLCAALGLEGATYAALLDRAWRHVLTAHPHDDVCGCSVDAVHEDDAYELRQGAQIAHAVAERAAARLASLAGLSAAHGETILLVHNGHARRARTLVEATVVLPVIDADGVVLYDVDGAVVPIEVRSVEPGVVEPRFLENSEGTAFRIAFVADVPAAGYTFYRAAPAAPVQPLEWTQPAEGVGLGAWLVSADARGISLRAPGAEEPVPLILEDEVDDGDVYSFSPLDGNDTRTVRVMAWRMASSAVGAHVTVDLELDTPTSKHDSARIVTPLRVELSAAHESDELRIAIVLETRARDHRLRLLVPTGRPADRSVASVPFGAIERDHTAPTEAGSAGEGPYPTSFSEDFVLVQEGGAATLIAHRGLHEYEAVTRDGRGYVAITLLRAVGILSRTGGRIRSVQAGPALLVPGAQCLGPQRCELSLRAGKGALAAAEAAALAGEFARPPLVVSAAPGAGAALTPVHPARRCLVRIAPDGVEITSLRVREDGQIILRLLNRNDAQVEAAVDLLLPFEAVDRCRLDETQLVPVDPEGTTVRVSVAAGELLTLCYTLVP